MESEPWSKDKVVHVATPAVFVTATEPQPGIVMPLLVKAMLPENCVVCWALEATVAVKVTDWLTVLEGEEAVTTVVVAVAVTV
jgi:hypothetical protein